MSLHLHLHVVRVPTWPKLGWVAACDPDRVTCWIGPHVEEGDGWVAEGAWAGAFAPGYD